MLTKRRIGGIAAAAVASLTVISACSGHGSEVQRQTSNTESAPTSWSAAPAAEPRTDADVAFAQGMIPHHEQAIEMTDILLAKRGVDPRVVSLANEIRAAQTPEVEQLTEWLHQWGTATASSSSTAMPMSPQDMAALRDAPGEAAGRLFLTQMIRHHEGAIPMALTEIGEGQFPAARAMAQTILSTQKQEIATMKEMLDSV